MNNIYKRKSKELYSNHIIGSHILSHGNNNFYQMWPNDITCQPNLWDTTLLTLKLYRRDSNKVCFINAMFGTGV